MAMADHWIGGTDPDRVPATPRDDDLLDRAHRARLLQAGQMLGGIVHEIKNPLAVIQGYTQLLHDRCGDEDDQRDLQNILQETRRVGALVEDMLSFLRRGSDLVEQVDLCRVVQAALNLASHDLRQARVSVVAPLPERTVLVSGQHGAYLQVLLNLLQNAWLSLQENEVADRAVWLAIEPGRPGRTQLVVANNGPPIPPEHAQTIFDPFFTTRGEGRGTGLGLALCREILARFGASIALDRPDGERGVRFRLDLPDV